ncbi:MAG: glutamate--tRNA ligase [Candidatus Glassbacteria bacterium]|nr:glutamate--tRNA ligase [Candidatus Glassbacteria bacterium]
MSGTPVVRFAPSPTGYLHLGGARTALFNYLFARHHGGTFLLRIEDTDRERSTPEATAVILEGLRWLGLDWDGGIVHQSAGIERHKQAAERLMARGDAYRCFCAPEELAAKRELAMQQKRDPLYDGSCRALSEAESDRRADSGEKFAVRFRTPGGRTTFEDLVHGELGADNSTLDDFIIQRSDGSPTYMLAVVADDIEMGITHVIRGDDHISNTPKQILLYRALDKPVPRFAHVPLILGPDRKRLSKRHGATGLTEYRDQGFLAPALFNFLALLGWSPGDDREIMGVRELITTFELSGINTRNAVFDPQKLEWMNGRYISATDNETLLELARADFEREGLLDAAPNDQHVLAAIGLAKERCRVTGELAPRSRFFFPVTIEYDPQAVKKIWKDNTPDLLGRAKEVLSGLDDWSEEPLEEKIRALAENLQIGAGKLIQSLRLAVTGTNVSPGIFETLAVIGRDISLERIERAINELG